ncbi:MAG TPA: TraB/GumN family protein [Allosphingosinicella sp.]|nr:TraB/GumN family protein [Allosphingosinicella sp.]
MLPFLRRLALVLGLPAAACASAPAAQAPASTAAKPAMWKLADADTTIYLFGTIHALPEGRHWRTPAFDRALDRSDELVLEVADVADMAASAAALQKLGLSPGLPPIAERVPEDKRAALRAAIAQSGIPEAVYDRLETWAAAIPILGVMFKTLGVDPELGVERLISAPFKGGTKKVTGLETVEQQFGFFDTLSEAGQRALLVSALEDPAAAKAQLQAMLDAWSSGDVKGIERTFDVEAQMSPELRTALLANRNAKWAEWLAKRLDEPGTVFVAVGAGHLAGKESVLAALKAKGLQTTRVQ